MSNVPALERGDRKVVLLTEREAKAVFDFMMAYRVALADKDAPEDLGRAHRVIGNQLDWIRSRKAKRGSS